MDNIMMPGNFLVLNIWVGSLFSMSVSTAFQIHFKCKSNNTDELRVEHFPRPRHSVGALVLSASRQGLSSEGRLFGFPGSHQLQRKAGEQYNMSANTETQRIG